MNVETWSNFKILVLILVLILVKMEIDEPMDVDQIRRHITTKKDAIRMEWERCTNEETRKVLKRKYQNSKSRLNMDEDSLYRWYKKVKLTAVTPKPEAVPDPKLDAVPEPSTPPGFFYAPIDEKTVS